MNSQLQRTHCSDKVTKTSNSHSRLSDISVLPSFSSFSMFSSSQKRHISTSLWVLVGVWLFGGLWNSLVQEYHYQMGQGYFRYENVSAMGHHRTRRFIIMTSERELRLPNGTTLGLELVMDLPGFSFLPLGFGSGIAISLPFDVDFDTLGLASEENTFGYVPWIDYVSQKWNEFWTKKYEKDQAKPKPKGGDRSIIYQVVEDTLVNLGLDGKACLLRTICEVHQTPLFNHGLLGEILEMILTVSFSHTSESHLRDYIEAENLGREGGQCWPYKERCPLSLFALLNERQRNKEEEIQQNFLREDYFDAYSTPLNTKNSTQKVNFHNAKILAEKKKQHQKYLKKYKKKYDLHKDFSPRSNTRGTHHREKRFIFFGPAGSILLPVGALILLDARLRLPYMTNLPTGYGSQLVISVGFKVHFDKLGLTSALNPWLTLPLLGALGRRKRDTWTPIPGVNYAGGDREMLYTLLEETLLSYGIPGQECLLRAVCEMQQMPLQGYGIVGEVIALFLKPSIAPHAELRLPGYLKAEQMGEEGGDCTEYATRCGWSLFRHSKEEEEALRFCLSRPGFDLALELLSTCAFIRLSQCRGVGVTSHIIMYIR